MPIIAGLMRTALQLLALLLLTLASLAIVFAVNAPRWMDGTPVQAPTTPPPK